MLAALATPEPRRITAAPFDSSEAAEWSLPALGVVGAIMAFLAPDPAARWDPERVDNDVMAALEARGQP
ncbi:hypothetical protein [Pseudonocardia sp. TRM90224]|uniref:hypothetical protein n=1 Tax=Pseudonocardia sp. TRM90224 TaxID=2812678 RepID=UPI001E4FD402|nr:hypothetical protein [Pseudonocardia sp. TRM90224]